MISSTIVIRDNLFSDSLAILRFCEYNKSFPWTLRNSFMFQMRLFHHCKSFTVLPSEFEKIFCTPTEILKILPNPAHLKSLPSEIQNIFRNKSVLKFQVKLWSAIIDRCLVRVNFFYNLLLIYWRYTRMYIRVYAHHFSKHSQPWTP